MDPFYLFFFFLFFFFFLSSFHDEGENSRLKLDINVCAWVADCGKWGAESARAQGYLWKERCVRREGFW